MMFLMILDRSIGLVSTIILARLLLPEDFGIAAMCTSLVAALQVFTTFSFDMVLIQRKDIGRDHYDTVWTLNLLFGFSIAIAIALLAVPISMFYQEHRVVVPILILAAGFMLKAAENPRVVDFRKDLQFHKETALRLSQKIVGFVVTVYLALSLESYWALIWGIFALNLSTLVLSFSFKPYMPRFTLRERQDIMGFSTWLFIMNMVNFIRLKASDFAIGRVSGASSLGLFEISRDLAAHPPREIIASMNRAIYPGYTKLKSDLRDLSAMFIETMALVSVIVAPIAAGIAAIADSLVPLLLGEKWSGAVPIVEVIIVYGYFIAMASNPYYVFSALDRPKIGAMINIGLAVVFLPLLILLTSFYGALGAAWAMAISSMIGLPIILVAACKLLDFSSFHIYKAIWRPVFAAGVMYCSVRMFTPMADNEWIWLALQIGLGIATYLGALVILCLVSGRRATLEYKIVERYLLPRLRG